MSRQRLIFLSLLGVALVGLVLDRTVFRPEGPAAAAGGVRAGESEGKMASARGESAGKRSAAGGESAGRTSSAVMQEEEGESLENLASLAQRVFTSSAGVFEERVPVRDLFSPTEAYTAALAGQPGAVVAEVEEPDPPSIAGLVAGPERASVLAGGELVELGSFIGPWRLVEVRQHGAVFALGERRVVVVYDGYVGRAAGVGGSEVAGR